MKGFKRIGPLPEEKKERLAHPCLLPGRCGGKCELRDLLHVPGVGDNPSRARGPHLTRRRHIFSWGNSLGPSTLVSWGSVSR